MSNDDRHEVGPQQREKPDPNEGNFPIPTSIMVLAIAAALWGIFYIFSANIDDSAVGDGRRTIAALSNDKAATADGAALFAANCQACHQATGQGLPNVFPPLAGSEWVQGSPDRLAKIVLHGVTGNLTVKAQAYNGVMPTFEAKFSDAELAAVLSYVRRTWGNNAPPVDGAVVKAARDATRDRNSPWLADDLAKLE